MDAQQKYYKRPKVTGVAIMLVLLIVGYKYGQNIAYRLTDTVGNSSSSNRDAGDQLTTKIMKVVFEPGDDVRKCSNKILSEYSELQKYISQAHANKTLCTSSLLRNYISHGNNFYGDGVWYQTSSAEVAEFYPNLCLFNSSAAKFRYCGRRNITNILLTGDSNGWKYFLGLLEYFKQNGWKCTVTRRETLQGSLKEKDYFWVSSIPYPKLHVSERGCTHCLSETRLCRSDDIYSTRSIKLEFIGMIHFIDSTLRLDYSMKGPFVNRLFSADTFLEYLLKYYLPHHGIPNLWILSSPIHHETWGSDLAKFRADLLYFIRLLEIYWPPTSELFILPDIRECPKMLPPDASYIIEKYLNTTRNEKIHAMNQILYQTFRDLMSRPGGNVHGFLDLAKITCPVMCSWHLDGGHMKPFWYTKMITYLFQLICSD